MSLAVPTKYLFRHDKCWNNKQVKLYNASWEEVEAVRRLKHPQSVYGFLLHLNTAKPWQNRIHVSARGRNHRHGPHSPLPLPPFLVPIRTDRTWKFVQASPLPSTSRREDDGIRRLRITNATPSENALLTVCKRPIVHPSPPSISIQSPARPEGNLPVRIAYYASGSCGKKFPTMIVGLNSSAK